MTASVNRIFLIGYMGCGKSTLGRRLSRRLGWRLVDTDAEVERLEGASVADIFRYEGEEHFRAVERRVVEELLECVEPLIISTGGGLPLWGDNMERIKGAGVTVYLHRSAENIASRLSPYGRQRRPKLRGLNDEELVAFMREDIARRRARYEEAELILEAELMSDEELARTIVEYCDKR